MIIDTLTHLDDDVFDDDFDDVLAHMHSNVID